MSKFERVKIGPFSIRPHVRAGVPSGSWQLDIPARLSQGGRRERHSFASLREAEAMAKRLARQVEVRDRVAGPPSQSEGLSFAELAQEWMRDQLRAVEAGLKRRSSLETNAHQLKSLLQVFAQTDIGRITREMIVEYQASRRRDGRKPETINAETATLKQVFRWAVERRLCREVPLARRIKVSHKRPDLPSLEEVVALMEHLSPKHALLTLVFAETGCRPAEVYGLAWRDIDTRRNTIKIRPSAERGLKTPGSERIVSISPSLATELSKHRADAQLVFGGENARVVKSYPKALKAAVIAAGIERGGEPLHIMPKTFRKAHATWQAERGVSESVLQLRLGHIPGSRVTKQYYISPSPEALRQSIIELPLATVSRTIN